MSPVIRLIRVSLTDSDQTTVIVHVKQKTQVRPLDLDFIATDNETGWFGSLKGSEVDKSKADQFSGDDDELRDVLTFALLQDRPDSCSPDSLRGVEIVGSIEKKKLHLTVRKNIGGIVQRLFSIALVEDDDRADQVSLFDWLVEGTALLDELRDGRRSDQERLKTTQDELRAAQKARNEDAQMAKKQMDDVLQKTVALLNTKKARIRELQGSPRRQLIKTEDDEMEDVQQAVSKKRAGKRKAVEQDVEMEDVEDDLDENPEQTDDGGQTEDEDEPGDVSGTADSVTLPAASQSSPKATPDLELPPRRELPFARKVEKTAPVTRSSQQANPVEDEETDEEL